MLVNAASVRFRSNPFCSRFVRPGAIGYRFPAGDSVEIIVNRLRQCQWRGAIAGAHGSGKSTLLCTLIPALHRAGWRPTLLTLHDRTRWLPRGWRPTGSRELLVVDGFEQLNRLSRNWLWLLCRARGWGLLATTHQPIGLPVVYRTQTSPELLVALVEGLANRADEPLSEQTLHDAFTHSQGNLREVFFALYDAHERRAFPTGAYRTADGHRSGTARAVR